MIFNHLNPTLKPCIASIMFRKIRKILNEGFQTQQHLPYGSVITRLAYKLKVDTRYDFRNLTILDANPRYLDLPRLYRAKFIAIADNNYHHLTYDSRIVKLPWVIRLTELNSTWTYIPEIKFVDPFSVNIISICPPNTHPDEEDP